MSATAPLPPPGLSTTVSACSRYVRSSGETVKPCVTRTRVPGPRQPATSALSSRRRTGGWVLSGRSATDLSTGPTAISSAVSTQRQTGEARTRSTRTPRSRNAAPSFWACWRPSSSRFRCVVQSSILKPGGSPPEPGGALAWRISATWPPAMRAAHACSVSWAAAPDAARSRSARPTDVTRSSRKPILIRYTSPSLRSPGLEMDRIEPLLQDLLGVEGGHGDHQPGDHPRPPRLMTGADARAVVPVEVLVEQDQVAPVWIDLELRAPTVHGAAPLPVTQEDVPQATSDFVANFPQGHLLA